MGFRKMLLLVKKLYTERPPKSIDTKGEEQFFNLIKKGKYDVHDVLKSALLRLPYETNVYFFETHDLEIPNVVIGGRENRLVGDTCRMFYKIKIEGQKAQYFMWDGIVPSHLRELAYDYEDPFEDIVANMEGVNLEKASFDMGLAMGKMVTKLVLTEKTKKAHQ